MNCFSSLSLKRGDALQVSSLLNTFLWASKVVLVAKNSPTNAGDIIDGVQSLGRSSGGGNGNPLQCSCLEDHMDRRA